MLGNKRTDPITVIPKTSEQMRRVLTFMIDDCFRLAMDSRTCLKQTLKNVRVFRGFTRRACPEPLVIAANPEKPIPFYGKVSSASHLPG